MNELSTDILTAGQQLMQATAQAMKNLYGKDVDPDEILLQKTRPEFQGDVTVVLFNLLPHTKENPEVTGKKIGEYLQKSFDAITNFTIIKGFLNLEMSDPYWYGFLQWASGTNNFGHLTASRQESVMVEFSSPNTNKPLHLGHIRNNLIGHSLSEILKATGNRVIKTNLVNDRGIHICKSMLAWKKWGNGETPETSDIKGDHLVGKYYVEFEKKIIEQAKNNIKDVYENALSKTKFIEKSHLINTIVEFDIPRTVESDYDFNEVLGTFNRGLPIYNDTGKFPPIEEDKFIIEYFKKYTPLSVEVKEMLLGWELDDKETMTLWKKMNDWVYDGFADTYRKLGIEFDKIYYESDTYLSGKKIVDEGLQRNVFNRKNDGSVWVDLAPDGLDEKLLLRPDGTSVYITQDIGTIVQRYEEYLFGKHIYVVGNEQDYHFKVLFLILKKLGYPWAESCYHLSYGMVDLPEGKMKSREGTVVDADDLMEAMVATARAKTKELGKLENIPEEEKEEIIRIIGMGALKYFILKVEPKKRMVFNPKESIDFEGNTGPFIQYTYARIQSLLRKGEEEGYKSRKIQIPSPKSQINTMEKKILREIFMFPGMIRQAAETLNPSLVANYIYELTKMYNHFYQTVPVLKAEQKDLVKFRLGISVVTGTVIRDGMALLGIEVPDKM